MKKPECMFRFFFVLAWAAGSQADWPDALTASPISHLPSPISDLPSHKVFNARTQCTGLVYESSLSGCCLRQAQEGYQKR